MDPEMWKGSSPFPRVIWDVLYPLTFGVRRQTAVRRRLGCFPGIAVIPDGSGLVECGLPAGRQAANDSATPLWLRAERLPGTNDPQYGQYRSGNGFAGSQSGVTATAVHIRGFAGIQSGVTATAVHIRGFAGSQSGVAATAVQIGRGPTTCTPKSFGPKHLGRFPLS
jgi:hypothetical protein